MKKNILYLGTILLIYCLACYKIYQTNEIKSPELTTPIINKIIKKDQIKKQEQKQEIQKDQIGYLKIDKLNLYQPLYSKDSSKNNVEENITILKESIMPTEEESIVFLAAHSGNGKIAFFEELDTLDIGDIINLEYKNTNYQYKITDIWEENKNGYIHVNKNNNKQLILTTCSPTKKNKQLIINSEIT